MQDQQCSQLKADMNSLSQQKAQARNKVFSNAESNQNCNGSLQGKTVESLYNKKIFTDFGVKEAR